MNVDRLIDGTSHFLKRFQLIQARDCTITCNIQNAASQTFINCDATFVTNCWSTFIDISSLFTLTNTNRKVESL